MPVLRDARFRAHPQIELRQLGELSTEEREPFRELERDADFYGLFVPKPPLRMNVKSVNRQGAELFRRLSTPSRLDPISDEIVDLVLDGILEVENGGEFVSGADALMMTGSLTGEGACPPAGGPAQLSRDALLHAQDLESSDPDELTLALYFYNCIPISPFWKSRFASPGKVLTHLGADRGALRRLLESAWIFSAEMPGWLLWSSKFAAPQGADQVTCKLYVSPHPERIHDAFEIVVRVLSDSPATAFKIGDCAAGMLRPDKLVAYFTAREPLVDAAEKLRRELAGCDAHGVPFSAGIDEGGLLSWGVDPPDTDRALQWLGRDSWRLWVARRLGAALSVARSARTAAAVEPWRFAIERARRHGVDVETWTPGAALWSSS